MEKAISVNAYIKKHVKQEDILNKLRKIIQTTILEETVKWGIPSYTCDNKNLLGIGAFKNHGGLRFFQVGLLNDSFNKLTNVRRKNKGNAADVFRNIG